MENPSSTEGKSHTQLKNEEASYSLLTYHSNDLPQAYRNMIFAKWLRSQRLGNEWFKVIHPDCYWPTMNKVVEKILADKRCKVRLAVVSDDHDVVLGFCVWRDAILDYIYVGKDYRGNKIGTNLVPKMILSFSHLTKCGKEIWKRSYKEWIFNPFEL